MRLHGDIVACVLGTLRLCESDVRGDADALDAEPRDKLGKLGILLRMSQSCQMGLCFCNHRSRCVDGQRHGTSWRIPPVLTHLLEVHSYKGQAERMSCNNVA